MCTCQSPFTLVLFLRHCSIVLCTSAQQYLIPTPWRMYMLVGTKGDTLVPLLFHSMLRQSDKAGRSVGAMLRS